MRLAILALGLGARFASEVLHHYSCWLLSKLLDGGHYGLNLVRDAAEFVRWLIDEYVHRWCGYSDAYGMN